MNNLIFIIGRTVTPTRITAFITIIFLTPLVILQFRFLVYKNHALLWFRECGFASCFFYRCQGFLLITFRKCINGIMPMMMHATMMPMMISRYTMMMVSRSMMVMYTMMMPFFLMIHNSSLHFPIFSLSLFRGKSLSFQ